MLVLDRIFDGDDVTRLVAIDLTDKRGERRRFSCAGRAADEHEPARLLHKLCERGREVELRKSRHIRGQCPKRCRECAPLAMDVDAKARRRRGEADGEVGGALRVHPLANSRGHEHRQ